MKAKYMKILACLMITLAILVAGCASEGEEGAVEESTSEPVKIGVVQWDDSRATSSVFTQILDEGGYEYEIVSADLGGLYQATSQGDVDVLIQAWLPGTQEPYWEEYGDDLVQAQVIASGARCGLVVPEYVPIDTIEELNDNADKFDNKISGIEPGAGIMQNTESCMVDYDLGNNFELYSSSTVGMTADLQDKIDNEEWVVATLWRPHWSFARIEGLKFLEDSQGSYGDSDNLVILTRTGFEEDNPEYNQLIQNFEMDLSDVESIMIGIDSGKTAEEAAADWLAENPEKFDEVLGTE